MQYVGVDIIEIERIGKLIRRWGETFLDRVYTPSELELYTNTSSLAVRFAAKEAILKALGACDKGISWQDIEILAEPNGKPLINLMGKAKEQARELSLKNLSISLSHAKGYAVAFVVGETP
ncbi:MAG: holo-ACP synthase [Dehalococcoidales bacterium]|nr:holo-ACP synthase [Dehalococcoidales bacterium]